MNTEVEKEPLVLSEREAVELLGFIVSSARGLLSEPQDYGPRRLLEAARRLSASALPRVENGSSPLLRMLAEEIPVWKSRHRSDHDGYVEFMDECCREIARELQRRDEAEAKGGQT